MTLASSRWIGTLSESPVQWAFKSTKKWTPYQDKWGNQVIRVGFPRRTCQLCPSRSLCTRSDSEPRRLTLRPKKEHELLQSIRVQQETDEWKKIYDTRAGVEGTISQDVRAFGWRGDEQAERLIHQASSPLNRREDISLLTGLLRINLGHCWLSIMIISSREGRARYTSPSQIDWFYCSKNRGIRKLFGSQP